MSPSGSRLVPLLEVTRMRIVVTGGSGFLGRPLCERLVSLGHEVVSLTRGGAAADGRGHVWRGEPGLRQVRWSATPDIEGWGPVLDGADAVINLAGESIAATRWTAEQKRRLEGSRLDAARAVGAAVARCDAPPSVLVNASAVGYYGDRGDERLTESSPPGQDFLAGLSVRWEQEAVRAGGAARVILLRTGIALARDGGVLAKLAPPFKLFVGGRLGSGRQYMPWIHREDWIRLVVWLLDTSVAGPVNATAPSPVTNRDFSRALGAALGRPSLLPAPAFALRLALGEMADALLLGGQRAVPQRAMDEGFEFRYPTLGGALASIY
jgi:uncharacterized protein